MTPNPSMRRTCKQMRFASCLQAADLSREKALEVAILRNERAKAGEIFAITARPPATKTLWSSGTNNRGE